MTGKWYAFNVDYVGEKSDGSDWLVYANEVGPEEVGSEPYARRLESGLYELPGPCAAVWHGYVSAASEGAAIDRVVAAYQGKRVHPRREKTAREWRGVYSDEIEIGDF